MDLLDEGRRFALEKLGLADSKGKEDLDELLATFSGPAAALSIDEFLPADHPWWIPAFERAAHIFISASWDNNRLPAQRELTYPVAPFPEEPLPFTESQLPPPPETHALSTSPSQGVPMILPFLLRKPQITIPALLMIW